MLKPSKLHWQIMLPPLLLVVIGAAIYIGVVKMTQPSIQTLTVTPAENSSDTSTPTSNASQASSSATPTAPDQSTTSAQP